MRLRTLSLVFALGCSARHDGKQLAQTYCGTCHAFPDPSLLDKTTWEHGVLPQMAPRLGVHGNTLFDARFSNPNMQVLNVSLSDDDWRAIVGYYRSAAPDSLPPQHLPAPPSLDPSGFAVAAFAPGVESSGIITLLRTDSVHHRIFVGDGGTRMLRVFDYHQHLLTSVTLGSAATDLIVDGDRVLVLEAGILNPNDLPRGTLVEYDDSLRHAKVLVDSLYRPVAMARVAPNEYAICEFGNNVGRLGLYTVSGGKYVRQVLDAGPGAIRVELHDLRGTGAPDIIALFAQGNERIVDFENDGAGHFTRQRILARFPPVYGSMFFTMRDMRGTGKLDIVYVNGDNFDYSRILKPYHGVRILENDGGDNYRERYFYPIYGAAQALVADINDDGKPDIVVTSNFADAKRHPERGFMYFQNEGGLRFEAYAFSAAAHNQWNVMTAADLEGEGRLDVLVGAMNLATVANSQQRFTRNPSASGAAAILVLANRTRR